MRLRRLIVASILTVAAGQVAPTRAADQPIAGTSLTLKRAGSKQKLVFVSKDPAFLFPSLGSFDDPTSIGLVVELLGVGATGDLAVLGAAAGPGWRASAAPARYSYADPSAPGGGSALGRVVMRQGKLLKITAPTTGLVPPQGSIGIRISTGAIRSCALFQATAVRKDVDGTFIGRNASAAMLSDCSDAQLHGLACDVSGVPVCGGLCPPGSACGTDLSSCFCISGAQPCGDTAPTCNGECPAGAVCSNIGGVPLPGCGCLPAGSTPCGGTYPTCDGDCPAATSCFHVSFPIPGGGTLSGCQCLSGPPVDECGGCPPGFTCVGGPVFIPPQCLAFCNGPSGPPVCDGTCPGSASCIATPGTCFCMP